MAIVIIVCKPYSLKGAREFTIAILSSLHKRAWQKHNTIAFRETKRGTYQMRSFERNLFLHTYLVSKTTRRNNKDVGDSCLFNLKYLIHKNVFAGKGFADNQLYLNVRKRKVNWNIFKTFSLSYETFKRSKCYTSITNFSYYFSVGTVFRDQIKNRKFVVPKVQTSSYKFFLNNIKKPQNIFWHVSTVKLCD